MPFRRALPAAGLAVVGLAVPASAPPPFTSSAAAAAHGVHRVDGVDGVEGAVIRRVNAIRHAYGLRRLRASPALHRAADAHSREMLRSNLISHVSPDGTPMERRVLRYVRANVVGETIGWVPKGTRGQASIIVDLWMRSPPHRAALMRPGFSRVGVSRRSGTLAGGAWSITTLDLASGR